VSSNPEESKPVDDVQDQPIPEDAVAGNADQQAVESLAEATEEASSDESGDDAGQVEAEAPTEEVVEEIAEEASDDSEEVAAEEADTAETSDEAPEETSEEASSDDGEVEAEAPTEEIAEETSDDSDVEAEAPAEEEASDDSEEVAAEEADTAETSDEAPEETSEEASSDDGEVEAEAPTEEVAEEASDDSDAEAEAPAEEEASDDSDEEPSGEESVEEESDEVEESAEVTQENTSHDVGDEEDVTGTMQWYILKVQVNREDSIRDALVRRIKMHGLEEFFGDVVVPTEDIAEFNRSGKRRIVKKKLFPGYIMVNMIINDDTWFLVRETSGIGDFTGTFGKPTPMSDEEVRRIIQIDDEVEEGEQQVKTAIPFKKGDRVRVKDGNFQNFEGEVDNIDEASGRVTIIVSIFGRSTPVELEHWQIEEV